MYNVLWDCSNIVFFHHNSHLKAKEKHHACVKTIQSFAGRLLTTVLVRVPSVCACAYHEAYLFYSWSCLSLILCIFSLLERSKHDDLRDFSSVAMQKDVSSANEGLVMSALNVLVYIMFIPQLLK